MNIILLNPEEYHPPQPTLLTDHRYHHIRQVLRATPGQTIRIGLINGGRGLATVEQIDATAVSLRCHPLSNPPDPAPVDLLLALPRPRAIKRLWPQLAALGVRRILLTNAEKVERCYFDTHVIHPDTSTTLLLEGLQQAGDTRLPQVTLHKQLTEALQTLQNTISPQTPRILIHPGPYPHLQSHITTLTPQAVLLAIGPEGGWTPYEITLFQQHQFTLAQIGHRILRCDTSAIAALILAHAALTPLIPPYIPTTP